MNRFIAATAGILTARRRVQAKRKLLRGALNRFLLVKTHAIGDVLMTTPAIAALRRSFPKAQIDYLTGEWSAPALIGNPYLDRIITFPDSDLHERRLFRLRRHAKKLKKNHYDAALIFHPSPFIQLWIYSARIPVLIGLDHDHSGFLLTEKAEWEPNGERYAGDMFFALVRMLKKDARRGSMQFFPEKSAVEKAEKLLEGKRGPVIALFPGGGRNPRDEVNAKRWPVDRFRETGDELIEQLDATVLVLAGPGEESLADKIKQDSLFRDNIIISRETTVHEMGALIGNSDLLITNDSAPMHLGAALGVPTTAIFGPTNPRSLLAPESPVKAVVSDMDCSPCYSNSPFPGCENPRCMDNISTDVVMEKAIELLETKSKQTIRRMSADKS